MREETEQPPPQGASVFDAYSSTLQMIQRSFVLTVDAQHRVSSHTLTLCPGDEWRPTNRPTVFWLWRWVARDLHLSGRKRCPLLVLGFSPTSTNQRLYGLITFQCSAFLSLLSGVCDDVIA